MPELPPEIDTSRSHSARMYNYYLAEGVQLGDQYWTIMHTDYRRPLNTFATTISAVVALHFYRTT